MIAPAKPIAATKRVAIYTRQSVEDTQSEYGSIQAQREAVAAYIASQRAHGWTASDAVYDDAGYSGGTVERPAFRRLLADVAAGRVDIVAVYKIDRLSRSIADFVQLMALFEKHGVEFVSVTQAFSTTSSVGRLTLNLLVTFAQFERETIAERTRDKMLAQRKRGMWTGGPTPWGYRLEAGKLLVDAEAADRVRQVFAQYLASGSVLDTVRFASQWRRFDKATMRRFLSSPVLIGMLRAGDTVVQGAHEAIVDRATWDRVQARLTSRAPAPVQKRGPRSEALLAGLAYCACGATMHQHFASRHRRRYSYMVCSTALKQGAAACPASRVATADLDRFVVDRVLGLAREPSVVDAIVLESRRQVDARLPVAEQELAELVAERARLEGEHRNLVEAIAAGGGRALVGRLREIEGKQAALVEPERVLREELAGLRAIDEAKLRAAAARIEAAWPDLFPAEQRRVVRLVVERVVYAGATNDVEVRFKAAGLVAL